MTYKVIKKRPWWPKVGTKCKKVNANEMRTTEGNCIYCNDYIDVDEYFEKIEEVKELPKTWEELETVTWWTVDLWSPIERLSHTSAWVDMIFPSYEQAEASIALAQLMQLRDVYRWDRTDVDVGYEWYCIKVEWSNFDKRSIKSISFPTEELRDQYQKNFQPLIDQVKILFYS